MSTRDEIFSCTQCGGSELKQAGEGKVACAYCGSIYLIASRGPTVIIRKGADVVFGKNAKVVINGGLEIETGSTVRFDGEITLLERAPEEAVRAAKLRLKEES